MLMTRATEYDFFFTIIAMHYVCCFTRQLGCRADGLIAINRCDPEVDVGVSIMEASPYFLWLPPLTCVLNLKKVRSTDGGILTVDVLRQSGIEALVAGRMS